MSGHGFSFCFEKVAEGLLPTTTTISSPIAPPWKTLSPWAGRMRDCEAAEPSGPLGGWIPLMAISVVNTTYRPYPHTTNDLALLAYSQENSSFGMRFTSWMPYRILLTVNSKDDQIRNIYISRFPASRNNCNQNTAVKQLYIGHNIIAIFI